MSRKNTFARVLGAYMAKSPVEQAEDFATVLAGVTANIASWADQQVAAAKIVNETVSTLAESLREASGAIVDQQMDRRMSAPVDEALADVLDERRKAYAAEGSK